MSLAAHHLQAGDVGHVRRSLNIPEVQVVLSRGEREERGGDEEDEEHLEIFHRQLVMMSSLISDQSWAPSVILIAIKTFISKLFWLLNHLSLAPVNGEGHK